MGVNRKFRKQLLLAKLEGTYGTDPVPVATADAMLVRDLQLRDWQGPTEQRGTIRPNLGNEIEYHTSPHVMLTFTVEMVGNGTAVDTPPPWGVLLKACSALETINALTSVVYTPRDEGQESVTCHFYWDGELWTILGARGNARFYLPAGRNPYITFSLMGLRSNATDVVLPTNEDYSAFQLPVPVNATNSTFSLAGVTGTDMIMSNLELDLGNQTVHTDVVGKDAIEITDRRPVGTCQFQRGLVADHDWDADVATPNLVVGEFIHEDGTTGRDIQIDMPKIQLLRPEYTNVQGVIYNQFQMSLIENAGLDEWSITCT